MSDDLATEKTRLPIGWLIALACVLVLGLLLLYATLGGPSDPTGPKDTAAAVEENPLEKARQSLARSSSPESCQAAIQLIRTHLSQENASEHTPPWDAQEKAWALGQLGLSQEEQEEVSSPTYTALDAAHLEACLLLRDAARSLAPKGGDRRSSRSGLEQAKAAFAWVVRQARLQETRTEPVPPSYVLSRGWGSVVERSLVFLALLEQLGSLDGPHPDLLGCLLMVPGSESRPRLWACGVVVGDGPDVYLFDPRLGLPLPGPKGEGVATLKQAQIQEDVLGQLPKADKARYDVTRAEAQKAQALLVCSLSSLAPRMRYLQDTLLQPTVKVRLARDPQHDLKTLHAAVGGDASFLKGSASLLRRFLPTEEGGIDKPESIPLASLGGFTVADDPTLISLGRKQRYQLSLVPWPRLPQELRDPQRFPYNVGLGERVRNIFARPFRDSLQSYNGPRHLLLRGRYDQAVQELMEERVRWKDMQKQRASAGDLRPRLNAWVDEAIKAYAKLVRASRGAERAQAEARVEELWKTADALGLFLGGAIADAREPQIVYLIALCKHEQAVHLQGREGERAEQAWRDALHWWTSFLNSFPQVPQALPARRLQAAAQQALGDHKAARASLNELAASLSGLEKVAVLYQIEQLRDKK